MTQKEMIAKLQKELEELKGKVKKDLPEVLVEGKIKDGFLYIKVPVKSEFTETFEGKGNQKEVNLTYLFKTGYKAVKLEGTDYKVKLSVFR